MRVVSNQIRIQKSALDQKQWYAIYTKFKAEKFVQNSLIKKGVEAYLPLMTLTKRYIRKIKKYETPLINSYVFVCINKTEINKVLETEYVSRFIKHGNRMIPIPKGEIDVLKRIVGDIQDISVDHISFSIGDEVEIFGGHLNGIRGKLISSCGKKNFIVELNHIGLQLTMNIDVNQLRKIAMVV